MPTALEIAQKSGTQFLGGILNFTRKAVPIFNSFYTEGFIGTKFKALAIEVAGATGGFVNLGEGYTAGKTPMTVREFAAARINFLAKVQKSTALLWDEANGANTDMDYFSIQEAEEIKSKLLKVEQQLIYGTSLDSKGFPGMKQLTPALTGNTLVYATPTAPEADGYVRSFINAGGTTASTASSIYLVKMGPLDAVMKMGGPQGVGGFLRPTEQKEVYLEFTDPVDQVVKGDTFLKTDGEGYVGLSVAGANEVGTVRLQQSLRRIGNVTNDSGKGCTEALLDYGIESLPPEKRPDIIYLSPRSLRQLRDSKTAATVFLMGGGDAKAAVLRQPLPEYHRGIPLIPSENILSTDAIEVPS